MTTTTGFHVDDLVTRTGRDRYIVRGTRPDGTVDVWGGKGILRSDGWEWIKAGHHTFRSNDIRRVA
jgi:hypothetical protein